jgi:hypothetical protein
MNYPARGAGRQASRWQNILAQEHLNHLKTPIFLMPCIDIKCKRDTLAVSGWLKRHACARTVDQAIECTPRTERNNFRRETERPNAKREGEKYEEDSAGWGCSGLRGSHI